MSHTLEIDSVMLEFGRHRVLQDVYLKCETGKVTGLMGRNGTGKSCLLNILYGVLKPNNRSIRVDGIANHHQSGNPFTMRFLPQHPFIPKSLKLKRVFKDFRLDFPAFLAHFPSFERHYNSGIKTLSGGERRLVEVYSVLMAPTQFCMLDEPFSHIMPVHVDTVKKLIRKEKEQKGIILTDHLYTHIFELSDRTYLIEGGKTYPITGKEEAELLGYIRKVD